MKFLAATFPGNSRAKICSLFRQYFAAFFARVGEKFRLNFALGNFPHKAFIPLSKLLARRGSLRGN